MTCTLLVQEQDVLLENTIRGCACTFADPGDAVSTGLAGADKSSAQVSALMDSSTGRYIEAKLNAFKCAAVTC
ncbi:hypothetical protein [Streptomyces sp. NPDC002758]